jgi:hypothetical protein
MKDSLRDLICVQLRVLPDYKSYRCWSWYFLGTDPVFWPASLRVLV